MTDPAATSPRRLYQSLFLQVITAMVIDVLLGHFWPATGEAMKPLGGGMPIDPQALDNKAIAAYTGPGKKVGTVNFLLNIIPSSVVDAFAKGEILQVLPFLVMFGPGWR